MTRVVRRSLRRAPPPALAFAAALLLSAAFTPPVAAAPPPAASAAATRTRTLVLDRSQSTVAFTLADVLHTVHGTFTVEKGEVAFDDASGAIGGLITVNAASGESGSHARDARMTEDELKAKLFPTVTFEPSRLTGSVPETGTANVQVEGVFTLLGHPHPLRLPMTLNVTRETVSATGSFSVPYVEWGLKDPSTFVLRVAKEVRIDLVLKGHFVQPSSAAPAAAPR